MVRGGEKAIQIGAWERFTEQERALVHRTVAPNTSPEELLMFLSVCANYNLDPLQREMWCIKMPGSNGTEGRLTMIVGKYGWLKIVERRADYSGTTASAVYANDSFKKLAKPWKTPTGQWSYVKHEYDVTEERGKLLGAYAEVYRVDRPTEFFWAPFDQYQPFMTERRYEDQTERDFHGVTVFLSKKDLHSPWLGQTDTMMEKCARTTAWRNAFPIGALYGEEEMASAMAPTLVDGAPAQPEFETEWGEDPELAEWLQSLFTVANNLVPNTYTDAKIRLMLGGLTDEDRAELALKELVPFIENHGGEVPEKGTEAVADSDIEFVMPEAGDEGEQPETLPGM